MMVLHNFSQAALMTRNQFEMGPSESQVKEYYIRVDYELNRISKLALTAASVPTLRYTVRKEIIMAFFSSEITFLYTA
jgi:hypothetical protein